MRISDIMNDLLKMTSDTEQHNIVDFNDIVLKDDNTLFSNTSPSFNMKRKQLDSRCCILAKFRKFAWYGKEFTNKE